MSWYENQNGNSVKPDQIDRVSSKTYVYVRKDFIECPEVSENNETIIPAHWKWMEIKIPKTDWELYEKILSHDTALDDVYAALTELAEIIVGEE